MGTSAKFIQSGVLSKSIIVLTVGALSSSVYAWDTPTNLREDDDVLIWDSNAPSYNIYEDGNYVATVHGADQFKPIFSNSLYQVVAHDYGTEFSSLSEGFLYIDDDGDDSEETDDELEFEEAELYFELNNTDGDLGIHSIVDGDEWTNLVYEDTNGRVLLDVQLSGALAQQGLTEFFFESAEPTFDVLAPADFFARFPAGTYDFEGITVDGEEIEAETELSQVLPAPAVMRIGANASGSYEGCNDDPMLDPGAMLDLSGGLPVQWDPVLEHHPEIGTAGEVDVEIYQFVYESENIHLSVELDADTTSFTIPAELISKSQFGKLEIIVRDATYNQVGTEACFQIM